MKSLTHHWLKVAALLVLILLLCAIPVFLAWVYSESDLASEDRSGAIRLADGIEISELTSRQEEAVPFHEKQKKQFPYLPGVGYFNSSVGMSIVFVGLFVALLFYFLVIELREIRSIYRRRRRWRGSGHTPGIQIDGQDADQPAPGSKP